MLALRIAATALACALAFCIASRAGYAITMAVGLAFSGCWIVIAARAKDGWLLANNLLIVAAYVVGAAARGG